MNTLFVAAFAVILAGAIATDGHAQTFQVVVHDSNPVMRLSDAELAQIFMRQQTNWSNGTAIVPVDLSEKSDVRAKFSDMVLHKTTAQVKAHWQRQVFSGRGVPPAEQKTDHAALAFVAANPGAIAYVADGTVLPNGVRAVTFVAGGTARNDVVAATDLQKQPELIARPAVRYPQRQLQSGNPGQVTLQFVVDAAGRVDTNSITVVESTDRDFEAPAIEAIRRSTFRPGQSAGRAVSVQVRQAIRFALAKS